MKPFVVSPHAADDINEIWFYLADEFGEEVANRILHTFVLSFADLAEMPGLGHRRSDLTSLPLHFYLSKPYLIIYQRDISPVPIHAVLHASRDLETLLRNRPIS